MAPIPPTLRAPAEPWRSASVVVTYGPRHGPHSPVAVDYALWLKREDGGRAVAVKEAAVGERLERDLLARALARAAGMGLA